jgi:hypothetical protein
LDYHHFIPEERLKPHRLADRGAVLIAQVFGDDIRLREVDRHDAWRRIMAKEDRIAVKPGDVEGVVSRDASGGSEIARCQRLRYETLSLDIHRIEFSGNSSTSDSSGSGSLRRGVLTFTRRVVVRRGAT